MSLQSNGLLNKDSGRALADALKGNSILTELDISNNHDEYNMNSQDGPGFAQELAVGIKDNGALSILNLAENNLGELVIPAGWTEDYDEDEEVLYRHTDGTEQKGNPGKPEGIIAIANAIPDMGALTSLNLSSNDLRAEGAKIVAEAIEVTNFAFAVVLVLFSSPFDHWLNCCCLLLYTG